MVQNNISDVALILEGGGMRASYTAPVIWMLLKQQLHFDYVAGISAGVTHLVNYLSRDLDRTKRSFTDFAADPNFGGLSHLLQGHGLFNSQYIYQDTAGPDQALPFNFEAFYANPAKTRIGAFECETGKMVYFDEAASRNPQDLLTQAQASSAIPLMMPTVTYRGKTYVDGALGQAGGIPIDIAKQDGYRKFFVVLSRERGYVKEEPKLTGAAAKLLFKKYPALLDALEQRADNYNRTRAEIFELESTGQAYVFAPDHVPVENATMNVEKLKASYGLGMFQVLEELPKWAEFLGKELFLAS